MATKSNMAADIDEWVKENKSRLEVVTRFAVQDTVNIAQTPVGKGGKMRVKTGFLRASGQSSLNGMPTGPSRGEKKEPNSYDFIETSINSDLMNLKVGGTFFFGWTANYARYRETYDGFLENAVRQWPETVRKAVERVKGMYTK